MNSVPRLFSLIEVSKQTGLSEESVLSFVERNWISPCHMENDQNLLDQEDLARIQLILDLQQVFGANDESIPVILHLLDQLHCLRTEVRGRL